MVCELGKSLNDHSLALKEVTSFVINRDKIVVVHIIYRRTVKMYLNCSQNTAGPGRWFSGHSTWHEDLPEFRPLIPLKKRDKGSWGQTPRACLAGQPSLIGVL